MPNGLFVLLVKNVIDRLLQIRILRISKFGDKDEYIPDVVCVLFSIIVATSSRAWCESAIAGWGYKGFG